MNLKLQVSDLVLSSKIDEEVVLMSIEAGYYFTLDPIGSRIWELLSEKSNTLEGLVQVLMEEYEVDESTCRADVQAFIEDMSVKKLILSED
jgi:hypothetical protein